MIDFQPELFPDYFRVTTEVADIAVKATTPEEALEALGLSPDKASVHVIDPEDAERVRRFDQNEWLTRPAYELRRHVGITARIGMEADKAAKQAGPDPWAGFTQRPYAVSY